MLPEAKQKLIFLYTKMTGAILTFVVIMAFFVILRMGRENARTLFEQDFEAAMAKLSQESVISAVWIKENQGLLAIWDNGAALSVLGESRTAEEQRLLAVCMEQGQEADISPTTAPLTEKEITSDCYRLRGRDGRFYLGKIGVVRVNGGFRGIVYLWAYSDVWRAVGQPLLWLLLSEAAGIAILYMLNRKFIGRVLEPVEKSRRQQAEFVAAASHELRTPLAVMKANLSVAEAAQRTAAKVLEQGADEGAGGKISTAADMEEFLRIMRKECDRLNGLTEDLLLLAAADAGQWQLEPKWIDTEGLLIELYESYEAVFQKQGLRLCLDFPADTLPELYGDERRLKQMFSILLTNALRFAPAGSSVRLLGSVDRAKKRLWLRVEDHGVGIPPELREKVFERFYQADSSRGEQEHFGLGLSVARELAVLQGGQLFCEETAGGGATFVFSVPF